MYKKIMREIEEIKSGISPVKPQTLANNAADMLSDGEITTGQYLDIMNILRDMID